MSLLCRLGLHAWLEDSVSSHGIVLLRCQREGCRKFKAVWAR